MNVMDKCIGIVIPSFNQGKYIEAAIRSVIENRKYANISLAVVDGGSTDNTKNIILKYQSEINAWCSEKDNGQADAINKGIKMLPFCDYYMWLNSDDIYESEHAVAQIATFAEKNGIEVCYGKSHFIDETGNVIGKYPIEKFSYTKLGKKCYLSQPSVLFSREAYRVTGPLNEALKMCLDYEYWIRLAQHYQFGFLREYIGATRIYGETKTATMQQIHLQEAITILDYYYKKVPMHWIITKILADNPSSLLQVIPRTILMVLLYPQKKQVIEQCKREKIYVKSTL